MVLKAGPTTIWKYRDLGALPDFTWRDAAYDDSGWASGKAPLGYGKADITANGTTIGWGPNNSNRYLTSYARTTFTLADPTGITGMALKLRGTDGAAVFVNGRLAYNDNLPAALEPDLGALTARDTAALDIAREFRVPVSSGMLVAGTNVVAVEFHKYAPNSTYLAFDMELSLGLASAATPPPSPPTGVTATAIAGPKVQVGWDAVTGAASYAVLRNGTQIGSATSPGFTDTSPPSGTDAVVHRPHRRRPRPHLLRLDGGHGHDHTARGTGEPHGHGPRAARPCSSPGTPSEGRAATSCSAAGAC